MKYITKVVLENFQSHKYTVIDFDRHLNVIVGPSDQGKSAIIRGIKWVLYNEPSGTFFIREGEKECSVTLFFNDNTKLKRVRTPSKNLYMLYDESGTETIYEGFGTSVPVEITEKINIKKIYIDGNQTVSLNVADQLEGPFLLIEKPSSRANAIGRLVGVHIVDKAISDVLKDIRNLNISKKSIESDLDDLERQLREYDYLEDLKVKIKKIEKLYDKIKILDEKLQKMINIKESYNKIELEKVELTRIINSLGNLDEISKKVYILEKMLSRINNLVYMKNQYERIVKEIKYNSDIVISLGNIKLLDTILIRLESNLQLMQRLNKLNANYTEILKSKETNLLYIEKLKNINEVENLVTTLFNKNIKLEKTILLKAKIDDIYKRLLIGSKYLEALKEVDKISDYIDKIKLKTSLVDTLQRLSIQYKTVVEKIHSTHDEIQMIDKNIEKLLSNYGELLKQIELCPLCLSKIDSKAIKRILESYR